MTAKSQEIAPDDSPFLAEIRALAALGESEQFGEADIAGSLAAMARLVRMDLTNVYDLQAALYITRELGMILVELRNYQLSDTELRQLGAIVHCLADNAIALIQSRTQTTLEGMTVPLRQKH